MVPARDVEDKLPRLKTEANMGCVRETPPMKKETSTGCVRQTSQIKIKPVWDF